jgi:hypothetical protein
LSIVSDVVYGDSLEYEDEYDDTYDDNMIGEREPGKILYKPFALIIQLIFHNFPDDEMTERRPFVTPRVLRGKYVRPKALSNICLIINL